MGKLFSTLFQIDHCCRIQYRSGWLLQAQDQVIRVVNSVRHWSLSLLLDSYCTCVHYILLFRTKTKTPHSTNHFIIKNQHHHYLNQVFYCWAGTKACSECVALTGPRLEVTALMKSVWFIVPPNAKQQRHGRNGSRVEAKERCSLNIYHEIYKTWKCNCKELLGIIVFLESAEDFTLFPPPVSR